MKNISTEVIINDLVLQVKIGAYEDGERDSYQKIFLQLKLKIADSLIKDQIEDTVDYAKVVEILEIYSKTQVWKLLEVYVQDLAKLIFEKFPFVDEININAEKRDKLPNCQAVGVKRVFTR